MLALVLADLVNRHDPGMVEIGGCLGLDVEPLDVRVVGELSGEDHLQGDRAIERHLPGLEHDPHAAPRDLADDLVVAEIADAGRSCLLRLGRGERAEVDGSVTALWQCGVLVDVGCRARDRQSGGWARRQGRRLGDRGGRRGNRGLGDGGSAGLGSRDCRTRLAKLVLESLKLGPQGWFSRGGDFPQIVINGPPSAGAAIGLELAAGGLDAPGQLEIQVRAVEIEIG